MRARKKSRTQAAPKGNRKPGQRRATTNRVVRQTTTKKPASKVKRKKASKQLPKEAGNKAAKTSAKKVTSAPSPATTKGGSSTKSLLKMVKRGVQNIVKTVLAPGTKKAASTAGKRATAGTKLKGLSPRPSAPKVEVAALEDATLPPAEHQTPPAAVVAHVHKPLSSVAARVPRTATPVPRRAVVPPLAGESAEEQLEAPLGRSGGADSGGAGLTGRTERGSAASDAQVSARPDGPHATAETPGGDSATRPPLPVPIASFTI